MADVHHMIDATGPGDQHRRFVPGAKIANPTKTDKLIHELRVMAYMLDDQELPAWAEVAHNAADHLLFIQRGIGAAIGRLEDINRD